MDITVGGLQALGSDRFQVEVDGKTVIVSASLSDIDHLTTYVVQLPNGQVHRCTYDTINDTLYDEAENVALLNVTMNPSSEQSGGGWKDIYQRFMVAVKMKAGKSAKVNKGKILRTLLMILLASAAVQQINTVKYNQPNVSDIQHMTGVATTNVQLLTPSSILDPIIDTGVVTTFLSNASKLTSLMPGRVNLKETQSINSIPLPPVTFEPKDIDYVLAKPSPVIFTDVPSNAHITMENEIISQNPALQNLVNETCLGTQCLIDQILAGQAPVASNKFIEKVIESLEVQKDRIIENFTPDFQRLYEETSQKMNQFVEMFDYRAEVEYHVNKYTWLSAMMLRDALDAVHDNVDELSRATRKRLTKVTLRMAKASLDQAQSLIQSQWMYVTVPIMENAAKLIALMNQVPHHHAHLESDYEPDYLRDLNTAIIDLSQSLTQLATSIEFSNMSVSKAVDYIPYSAIEAIMERQVEVAIAQADRIGKEMIKLFNGLSKEVAGKIVGMKNAFENLQTKWDRFKREENPAPQPSPVNSTVTDIDLIQNDGKDKNVSSENLNIMTSTVKVLQSETPVSVVPMTVKPSGAETTVMATPTSTIIVTNPPVASPTITKTKNPNYNPYDPFSAINTPSPVPTKETTAPTPTSVDKKVHDVVTPLVVSPDVSPKYEIPTPTVEVIPATESPVSTTIVVDPIPTPPANSIETPKPPAQVMNEVSENAKKVAEFNANQAASEAANQGFWNSLVNRVKVAWDLTAQDTEAWEEYQEDQKRFEKWIINGVTIYKLIGLLPDVGLSSGASKSEGVSNTVQNVQGQVANMGVRIPK